MVICQYVIQIVHKPIDDNSFLTVALIIKICYNETIISM